MVLLDCEWPNNIATGSKPKVCIKSGSQPPDMAFLKAGAGDAVQAGRRNFSSNTTIASQSL